MFSLWSSPNPIPIKRRRPIKKSSHFTRPIYPISLKCKKVFNQEECLAMWAPYKVHLPCYLVPVSSGGRGPGLGLRGGIGRAPVNLTSITRLGATSFFLVDVDCRLEQLQVVECHLFAASRSLRSRYRRSAAVTAEFLPEGVSCVREAKIARWIHG